MSTIKDPVLFSTHFGLEKTILEELGALDPVLNVDTKLFIDPMLLESSIHSEMANAANTMYGYFEMIVKLLFNSKTEGDLAWNTAYKKFLFSEISGTCIGYGSGIHGQGWGPIKARALTRTAKEIIDLGVKDSDLFMAIPLLEANIGPDLISDMVTNIAIDDILNFNERILFDLGVPTEVFTIKARNVRLCKNPTEANRSPVILLPNDILRNLPLANDWSEVCIVAAQNEHLREKVSGLIGEIWRNSSTVKKAAIREKALSSADAFLALLATIREAQVEPYDVKADKDGHFKWIELLESVSNDYPLKIAQPKIESPESLMNFVSEVVNQFSWLIEERGLSRLLWKEPNKKRVKEDVAQLLFYAVSEAYARANNIDITPEADIGRGAVDFKFSSGYNCKVLVEIKFSDHSYVVSGYEKQLEIYKSAERTEYGCYLVIDVGCMGEKETKLLAMRQECLKQNGRASELMFIDGNVQPSASKVH